MSKTRIESHPTLSNEALLIREWGSNPNRFNEHRAAFIAYELRSRANLFENIGGPGKNLDRDQAEAVITCEDSTLVVAGAGSGKTLTVVGKIRYLIERYRIKPEEIIVVSFTRDSSQELSDRISATGIEGVVVKDFHALGLSLFDSRPGIANENQLDMCVHGYLENEIALHPDQTKSLLEFYGYRAGVEAQMQDKKSSGSAITAMKASDMRTIKGMMQGAQLGMDTMQGERVKSFEELMIANFLYLNGIEYEYEKVYPYEIPEELDDGFRHRAYQPDFYLSEYDIWLEHFGIDEHGHASFLNTIGAQRQYEADIVWKRQLHEACGTNLIESYHFWYRDQDLINQLARILAENGVKLVSTPERISEIYSYLSKDRKFCDSIIKLIKQFITLCKTNNISLAEAGDRARMAFSESGFLWERYNLFASFVTPIFELYQNTLRDKGQIDFEDMINLATEKVREDGYPNTCRYIIVDEFQDTSAGRFALVQAIREATGAKLMCVGDDWQSIFRFTGSDIGLFTHFGKHVGNCEIVKLSHTYRNSQELVNIASEFVMANPAQLRKQVISNSHMATPVTSISISDQGAAFVRALDMAFEDAASSGISNPSILVLGRMNSDIENALKDVKSNVPTANLRRTSRPNDKNVRLSYNGNENIRYLTVHRSKGLEGDYVIILNVVNDTYGFPNLVANDPIIDVLLDNGDDYPLAEERRLFYVALTRARRKVWIIADSPSSSKGPSPFLEEIAKSNISIPNLVNQEDLDCIQCPSCGGRIVRRTNSETGEEFLGCSNYPMCNQTYKSVSVLEDKVICPECGGWMIRRNGPYGQFFGCTNYPYCKATLFIEDIFAQEYNPQFMY